MVSLSTASDSGTSLEVRGCPLHGATCGTRDMQERIGAGAGDRDSARPSIGARNVVV